MFFKNLSQTKKLFFVFETFILFLIIITIFLMKNLFDTNILIKEKDINKLKYIQILLFILFAINYLANIISKYEMSGFKGNKFYANCCLIPGFLIGSYNLYKLFHIAYSEMLTQLLTLSINVFIAVDFFIDYNIYSKYNKRNKKKIYLKEGYGEYNLV
jgi:hypothetical protein